jgi:hypothetical protein
MVIIIIIITTTTTTTIMSLVDKVLPCLMDRLSVTWCEDDDDNNNNIATGKDTPLPLRCIEGMEVNGD